MLVVVASFGSGKFWTENVCVLSVISFWGTLKNVNHEEGTAEKFPPTVPKNAFPISSLLP